MSVKYVLPNGTQVALGWGLLERGKPVVRISFRHGGRRVMMLASPAQARGWMADILHEGGVEDLADGLRHAAWEALKLADRSPFNHT
jgi:hypothetical protein